MGVLRDRMIETMKLRNFSPATRQSYFYAVSRLAKYHNKSPDQLSKERCNAVHDAGSGCEFYLPRYLQSNDGNKAVASLLASRSRSFRWAKTWTIYGRIIKPVQIPSL
jgi:Phage integrase, N-terminal SAM-like domain